MCVDDAVVDNMPQSQNRPKLTTLVNCSASWIETVLRLSASCERTTRVPRPDLESGRHDTGESFVDDMDDLRDG